MTRSQKKRRNRIDSGKDRDARRSRLARLMTRSPQVETLESRQLLTTFANVAPITITDTGNADTATPYQSDIAVAGLTGNVLDVDVTLHDVSDNSSAAIEALLVGPSGAHTLLMDENGTTATNVTLTFDDDATGSLPGLGAQPLASGVFQPSVANAVMGFPAPAPPPAPLPAVRYTSSLASHNAAAANGTWSLFILSDFGDGADGMIAGGFSLDIITTDPVFEGTAGDNAISVAVNAGDNTMLDVTIDGNTRTFPSAGLNGLTINGGDGDDTFTIDHSNGNVLVPITYNGEGQATAAGDQLVVTGANVDTVQHTFTNANDGSVGVDVAGGGIDATVNYTGLEPVIDNLGAVNRVFTFTGGSETIDLGDDGGGANGMSMIDSTLGESVTFTNPTGSLTVNGGTGLDTINVNPLDAGFAANVTINGDAGVDEIDVFATTGGGAYAINGGGDDDSINIGGIVNRNMDAITSPLAVDGGGQTDVLRLVDNFGTADPLVTVTNNSVVGLSAGNVTYTGVTQLLVGTRDAAAGVVNVESTALGVATLIDSGADNDLVTIGVAGSLDGILGQVQLFDNFGGGVGDTFVYDDSADVDNNTYVLGGNGALTRGGVSANVSAGVFEDATLMAGTGVDSISLTPGGTAWTINGGNPVAAPGDSLTVDLAGTTGATLALTGPRAGQITFTSGQAPINFADIEALNPINGLLAIGPVNTGAAADNIVVSRAGANTVVTVNGVPQFSVPTAAIAGALTINGEGDNDTLTVEMAGGDPVPAGGLNFNGGGQAGVPGDVIILQNGAVNTVTHTFTNETDGTIDIDGSVVNYTGLEPVFDNLGAVNRVFLFSGATETITLGDNGAAADNVSRINSDIGGETVDFINPTGSLTISGGGGVDTINLTPVDTASVIPTLTVSGDAGDDVINGTAVTAGFTTITLNGNAGNDTITGTGLVDTINGGTENDIITGGLGNDIQLGDAGNDTFIWNNGDGADDNTGGADVDTFTFNGANGADDVLNLLPGPGDGSLAGAAFNLQRTAPSAFTIEGVTIENINVNTLGGNDTFNGSTLPAGIFTNVTISGGAGNDNLTGTQGIDTINGGANNDIIVGGLGADIQNGDAGDDLFIWNNGDGPDDNTGGADTDTFTFNGADGADDVLNLLPGPGDGSLAGAAFNLQRTAPTAFTIEGVTIENINVNTLAGNDTFNGSTLPAGIFTNVNIDGGAGNDILTGTQGIDTIRGGANNDMIIGGLGNDLLFGDAGDDLFTWNNGDGADDVTGGADTDSFVFNGAGADDVLFVQPAAFIGFGGGDGTLAGAEFDITRLAPTAFTLEFATLEIATINGLAGEDSFNVSDLSGQPNLNTLNLNGNADNDTFNVQLNTTVAINVDGNAPVAPLPAGNPGDTLNVTAPQELNIFSDKAGNVSLTSTIGVTPTVPLTFTSIETINATPSNGVVNLIGDNNNPVAPFLNQPDRFIVRGQDVDSGFGGDADGTNEFSVVVNGNAPISVSNTTFLNVNGNANGDATSTGIDTLDISPYADDTPAGWGIDVFFNEGLPNGADGGAADLIIYNTAAGGGMVSEDISVRPSGPDNGELVVTNGSFGTPIVDIDYVANTDIIINDNDGFANDTDTLTLLGTNPDNPGTSGNETVVADFTQAGGIGTPHISVLDGAAILYNVRNFTGFNTVNFDLLGGNDSLAFTPDTANANGLRAVGVHFDGSGANDTLIVNASASARIDTSTGVVDQLGAGVANSTFSGVEFVNATSATAASTLTVRATDDNDTIALAPTAVANEARVWINDGTVVTANAGGANANFGTVTLQGRFGSDDFSITPVNNVAVNAQGGDPTASDSVVINGTNAANVVGVTPGTPDTASVQVDALGLVSVSTVEHLVYNGQRGDDTLTFTAGGVVTHTPGEQPDEGSLATTTLLGLEYTQLGTAGTITANAAATLVARGTDTADVFAVAGATGNVSHTTTGGTARVPLIPNNVNALVINGLSGDDTVTIAGNHPYAGGVTVNGGQPDSGSDVLNFVGAGAAVTVDLAAETITEMGFGSVSYAGMETVNVDANAALTINGTAANDILNVTPTGAGMDGTFTHDGTLGVVFNYTDAATATFNGGGGTGDLLNVFGDSVADAITSAASALTVDGSVVTLGAGLEALAVHGLGGNDSINLSNLVFAGTTIVAGGDGTDTLTANAAVNAQVTQDATSTSGSATGLTAGNLTYSGLELFAVTSAAAASTLTVRGTNGEDTIAIAPTPVANEARVWINDGTVVTGNAGGANNNFATVAVQGRFGDDAFSVTPIAGVAINVAGGDATDADTVTLYGTAGVNAINVSPTTATDATVQVDALGLVTLATVESLAINGLAGADNLTYTSPGGVDDLIYSPGITPDAGKIEGHSRGGVPISYMPVAFSELTANGSLAFADTGAARTDVLEIRGTSSDDVFAVTAAGGILVTDPAASRHTVNMTTPGVNSLVLQGLDGDDAFNVPGNHLFAGQGILVEGGTPDNGSDVLNFGGAGAAVTADLAARTVTETGFPQVAFSGVETVNIAAANAALNANLTANDDELTYRPTGAAAGTFQNENDNTTFNFTAVGGAFTVNALASVGDHLIVEGTNSHDRIAVNSPARTATVTDAAGTALKTVTLANDVEIITALGRAGNDTFTVTPNPTVGGVVNGNLLINVDGGDPGASDALVIATAAGTTLPGSDFAVNAVGLNPGEGRVRVFRNAVAMPDISYHDVEIVSPNVVVSATGVPQLLVLGPDASEPNEFRTNATHLGAGDSINVDNLAIFPNFGEHLGVPNDVDFFQIVAESTGTLDVTAHFEMYPVGMLPGGGDLTLNALDSAGNVIAGAGAFGNADATPNARVRFPAVQGQTYFIRVTGTGVNSTVVNAYELTVTNEAPPVPYDLEINDIIQIGTVNAAIVPTITSFRAGIAPANGVLPPATFDYIGKTVEFTSGPNIGRSAPITSFNNATGQFTLGAGLLIAPNVTDTFIIESTDTGRSQLDNETRDSTPIITFRLDDDILLRDVPGDFLPGNPTDETIAIPFIPSQSIALPAAAVANAGFRVPVFIEGAPQQAGTTPQTPIGYARPLAGVPGVYVFDFGIDANPGGAALVLSDGSHFITAKVEIIDPSLDAFANDTGLGARSASLEIVVDTTNPGVAFGDPAVVNDGLHPDSDSGNPVFPATVADRITNDTTPTFFGQAEANSIVRAYVETSTPANGFDANDILIGQTVATPIDGTNQHPFGQWEITSSVDMNDPRVTAAAGVAAPMQLGTDGVRNIYVTAEDTSGNITPTVIPVTLTIFVDTQGPQVFDPDGPRGAGPDGVLFTADDTTALEAIQVTGSPTYSLFGKAAVGNQAVTSAPQGPTPAVNSLTINIRDLPNRAAGFLYAAISNIPAGGAFQPGLEPLILTGDHSGPIAITAITFTSDNNLINNNPVAVPNPAILPGVPATGFITITFASALPDDRFTLKLSDSVIDPAGNGLDGENNAAGPVAIPTFPSGDGIPGGDFVARFTVDSRPEVGVWSQGLAYVDINGNQTWDPEGEDNDATNRDFTYQFGRISDGLFAGNFHRPNGITSGFDKIGGYGLFNGTYSFLIDTDDDGVGDVASNMPPIYQFNGLPVAGNFDGNAANGDEIGVYTADNWYLDLNGNNAIDVGEVVPVGTQGVPVVGNFVNNGVEGTPGNPAFDDLAVYNNNTNQFVINPGTAAVGVYGAPITWDVNDDLALALRRQPGLSGFSDKPVAGDINLDGIDDIGVWVKHREGVLPKDSGEFLFWVSDATGPNIATNFNSFSPAPLGNDLFTQFGDDTALPIFGNFDPPVGEQVIPDDPFSFTNELNPNDVNKDGEVTAKDALVVINAINRGGNGELDVSSSIRARATLGDFAYDVDGNDRISAVDALRVINELNRFDLEDEPSAEPISSASEVAWHDAVDSFFDEDDDDEDAIDDLIGLMF